MAASGAGCLRNLTTTISSILYSAIANPASAPYNRTMARSSRESDKFYDEPENLRLPIFLAMRVFAMKVAGAKATEIEAVMNAAREYADKPDAKVQLKEPQAQAHRVLIAYPEHWNDGERRPCFLGPAGGGTVSQAMGQPADIPQLDCDRFVQGELIHRTPAERIFTLEVDFTGDFAGALESRRRYVYKETAWTCQRRGDAITCTP